jgi:putative copper resistance protein D
VQGRIGGRLVSEKVISLDATPSLDSAHAVTSAAGAPTTSALLATWTVHPLVLAILIAVTGLYVWGMLRVRRRHPSRPWPVGRAASFVGGLAVVVVAVMSAIGRYDTMFFWVHMIQHLLLIMVAPALLIHGRPLTLAMHASRNPLHTRIKRLLRSRAVTIISCPLVAVPAYAAIVVGTHLTSFNNDVVRHPSVAAAEQLAYLAVGYLYLLSGFGDEPIRWRLSRPAKMFIILLSMPIDTFTGITLLATQHGPWPAYTAQHHTWGPDPITDVHWGGAMMWIGGDTIMIALIVTALVPWISGRGIGGARMRWIEKARRANLDSYAAALPNPATIRADHADLVDDEEARLDAYNAWLAKAAANDRGQTPPQRTE